MLKDNIALTQGIKNLSATVVIIEDKKIEKELYVIARLGFFEATIIAVIIGKYELTNIIDVFMPVATSVTILLIGTITSESIVKTPTKHMIFCILSPSFKNAEAIEMMNNIKII